MKYIAAVLFLAVVLLLSGQGQSHRLPRQFVRGALCIHRHEGSWRDTGAPYWGGLQFDLTFQKTYAPLLFRQQGTADHWTPHKQIHAAWRAYHGWRGNPGRGWYPWPNTARACGLL